MSFRGLGFFAGYPGNYSSGICGDGSTVIGMGQPSSNLNQAFRWTANGGMQPLGFLLDSDQSESEALGVSRDGSVVVGYSTSAVSNIEAFRWTNSTGMQGLGLLNGNKTIAHGVNADGSVIVGGGNGADQAWRWTSAGGIQGLGFFPGGLYSEADGVSADGSVIIGFGDSAPPNDPGFQGQAFRWTSSGGIQGLGFLDGGTESYATHASRDGSTIIGYGDSSSTNAEAFRWTSEGGIQAMGFLDGGGQSWAHGVSDDGSVIVGESGSTFGIQAYVWDDTHGMRSLKDLLVNDYGLDLTGWSLQSAYGVSDDGNTIAGYGIDPAGNYESWIAQIPEPSSLALLGCVILCRAGRRRSPPTTARGS